MNLNNPIGYKSNQPLQKPFIMNPFRFSSSIPVGGWVEIGRTTNGSELDDISVGSLANKRYYMILGDMRDGTGSHGTGIIMNADTGTSYAVRRSGNGGNDNTNINLSTDGGYITDVRSANNFNVTYVSNLAAKEKLWQNQNVNQNTAGSGTAPKREEAVGKWANTSNAMSTFTYHNWHTGNYGTGSECVVLGWDPSDEHGIEDNFWQELASVDLSGGAADNLSSGTFTAKKYLFVQGYFNGSGNAVANVQFNGDTGSNYAQRYSIDGGSDVTGAPRTNLESYPAANMSTGTGQFINLFIINNSANEKLIIGHVSKEGTAGAGTSPNRNEMAWKWANTSSQITSINFVNTDTGNLGTTSTLKVWGHD